MKKNIFKIFNKFDIALWCCSLVALTVAFCLVSERDWLTYISSITGVSALMFIVKGNVVGQILTAIFAVFYGVVSYFFTYYGEMITYLCMSAPAAVAATISWLRHPYKDSKQVEIGGLSKLKIGLIIGVTAVGTCAFYFVLRALNTANLVVSTVSVTTSLIASMLVFFRSPYYGAAYAANDIVLVVLWVMACLDSMSYLPMVMCFSLFMVYDVYGFINWSIMKKAQHAAPPPVDDGKFEQNTEPDTKEKTKNA